MTSSNSLIAKSAQQLSPVPIAWVRVPKLLLFLLGQALEPVIALASCSRLVLIHAVEDSEKRQDHRGELAAQVDGVPGVVFGGVSLGVSPSNKLLAGGDLKQKRSLDDKGVLTLRQFHQSYQV